MMFYFKLVKDGKMVGVETKSVQGASPNFVEATEAEYNDFMASRPPKSTPKPPRDLAAEIDELKAKIKILESR